MQQENTFNNQQQTSMGQQGMQQPPAVMSTKDSLYLTDMMSWNLLAAKKAHFYATQCQDQQIVQALNKCGQMHQRHFDTILSHVQLAQQSQQKQQMQ
jgi:hypothetical protein